MDPAHFDLFTRSLSRWPDALPSRRKLLQAITAGLLAGGLAPLAEMEAKGKRRRRRKGRKHRRPCLTGQKRCKGRCAGCCNDADCGGNPCNVGVCADCPNGQRLCRGGCIPEDACCNDGECTGGRICVDGTCECAADERLCEGTCIPSDACCGTDCPIETCSAENCNGCCDGNTCRNGDSTNFCGRNGVACVPCAQGEICDAGECRGGGGTCSPETCNGCCDGNTCREGDSQNFCGRDGVNCARCGHDAMCNAGQCDCPSGSEMCPNGDCIPLGGCCADADCMACQACQNGQCVDTCPFGLECLADVCRCTADSCSGCCHDDICQQGDNDEFCGLPGQTCQSCLPDGQCLFGECICPSDGQFCRGVCCSLFETCCEAGSNATCCSEACCPLGSPNACCSFSGNCNTVGDPLCTPASAAVSQASSLPSVRHRRKRVRRQK